MKTYYCVFLLVLIVLINSCKEDETIAPLPMGVVTKGSTVLSYNKVKLTAEILNFDQSRIVECIFEVNGEGVNYKEYIVVSPSSKDVELTIEDEAFQALMPYTYSARVRYRSYDDPSKIYSVLDQSTVTRTFETDFPIVNSVMPETKVSDVYTMTIDGIGFNGFTIFYLGSQASPTSPMEYFELGKISLSANAYKGYLPIIGSRGKDIPTFFVGAIQPCALYIGNYSKSRVKKISDLDYTYLFSLDKKTASLGGSFDLILYYARQSPLLEGVEVYFDNVKVSILSRTYVWDFSVNGMIEGYRFKCQIPAHALSGSTYQIRVVSPFGEEFRVNNSGNEITID